MSEAVENRVALSGTRAEPAWLFGIIVNLLLVSGFYDIALRDFGLMLAAIALARLSVTYDRGVFGRTKTT
jgi:hypothetical protein